MSRPPTDGTRAKRGARAIYDAFNIYRCRFKEITRRAQLRFNTRDWQGMRSDAVQRLDLYTTAVDCIEKDIRRLLADRIQQTQIWTHIKEAYSGMLLGNDDWELAETFFNSITRRIFATVGVDAKIEFVNTDFATSPNQTASKVFNTYEGSHATADLIRQILSDYHLTAPFQNVERDANGVADRIEDYLKNAGSPGIIAASIIFGGGRNGSGGSG